jgi:hypothetical protein
VDADANPNPNANADATKAAIGNILRNFDQEVD